MQKESVLVPINGRLVPFHITFIKSVSTQELGTYTYLRINLASAGSTQAAQALQVRIYLQLGFWFFYWGI